MYWKLALYIVIILVLVMIMFPTRPNKKFGNNNLFLVWCIYIPFLVGCKAFYDCTVFWCKTRISVNIFVRYVYFTPATVAAHTHTTTPHTVTLFCVKKHHFMHDDDSPIMRLKSFLQKKQHTLSPFYWILLFSFNNQIIVLFLQGFEIL